MTREQTLAVSEQLTPVMGPGVGAPPVSPFLMETQAAEYLRVSVRTLRKWRLAGGGPRFHKFGSKVLYTEKELLAWADAQLRRSTSEEVRNPGPSPGVAQP